jgi:aerobic carbon-monoxide dehydrogenase medium subunit
MSVLPPFDLHRPSSLEEALDLLGHYGDDAVLMNGGTELLLLLKLGLAEYGHIVDLKGIPELTALASEDGMLRIGAGVTHFDLERAAEVRSRWPALAKMERMVANVRVRAAGTLGGNLAFSDPHSDPGTFLLAAEAVVVLRSREGTRELPLATFLRGPYETALASVEVLTEVRVPAPPSDARVVHAKIAFHERPAATVTCLAHVEGGRVAEARVAVGSVGPRPVRATEAEQLLAAVDPSAPDEAVLDAAGEAAAAAAGATADANGSADYKRALVQVLVRRTFTQALTAAPAY